MTIGKAKKNGRQMFMLLRDEIRAELEAGAYAIDIHAKYSSRLGIKYRQFLKYIKRYIRNADPVSPSPEKTALHSRHVARSHPEPPAKAIRRQGREPVNTKRKAPKSFVFDPTDIDPDKLV